LRFASSPDRCAVASPPDAAAKPQLEGEQRAGRAIWWDKRPTDLKLRREMDEGRVPQKPYVYSTDER
jgi:hypothetical protein